MDSGVFYRDVVCVVADEGKTLFVKQSNGVKFSKVGAVLFSDKDGSIKKTYESDDDGYVALKGISLSWLQNSSTLIYRNIAYTMEGGVYTPDSVQDYESALNDPDNLLQVQIAYGEDGAEEDDETEDVTNGKYMSYDLTLRPNALNIKRTSDMDFDGFAVLGLPFKQQDVEQDSPIIQSQNYALLFLVYFPKEDEKLQILYNQPTNVAMNFEIRVHMDDLLLKLDGLEYVTNNGLTPSNPGRYLYGLHLTNDGAHDRG